MFLASEPILLTVSNMILVNDNKSPKVALFDDEVSRDSDGALIFAKTISKLPSASWLRKFVIEPETV